MRKTEVKKLKLGKETLKNCTEKDLSKVAGGLPPATGLSKCYCETDLCSNFCLP